MGEESMSDFQDKLVKYIDFLPYRSNTSHCQAKAIMQMIYDECCKRAEEKMRASHKLEGMHYLSLKEMMCEIGGEA